MARGRVGGTRSRIYGRVGNEIYSAKRDGDGSYSQVVSAVPEHTTDVLTPDLVRQRIRMSIIYKHMHMVPDVINASFNDDWSKSMNLQEFVRRNVARLKQLEQYESDIYMKPWYYYYGDDNFYPAPLILSMGKLPMLRVGSASCMYVGGKWTLELKFQAVSTNQTLATWLNNTRLGFGDILIILVSYLNADPARNKLVPYRFFVEQHFSDISSMSPEVAKATIVPDIGNPFTVESHFLGNSNFIETALQLKSDNVDGMSYVAGYCWLRSSKIDGQWQRNEGAMNVFRSDSNSPVQRLTLDDVWDSWYTDRI